MQKYSKFKRMRACNTFEIPVKCIVYMQSMAASALLKRFLSVEEWMTEATFVK